MKIKYFEFVCVGENGRVEKQILKNKIDLREKYIWTFEKSSNWFVINKSVSNISI